MDLWEVKGEGVGGAWSGQANNSVSGWKARKAGKARQGFKRGSRNAERGIFLCRWARAKQANGLKGIESKAQGDQSIRQFVKWPNR
jgi:hypothetical protein